MRTYTEREDTDAYSSKMDNTKKDNKRRSLTSAVG